MTRLLLKPPGQLRAELAEFFAATFAARPQVICLAPGRINLIGEHVDYNSGIVLPFALGLHTAVALRPIAGQRVRIRSTVDPLVRELDGDQSDPAAWPDWTRYVGGVGQLWRLLSGRESFGFELAVASTLPVGAGLSSSAALCVGLLAAFELAATEQLWDRSGQPLTVWEQARICQQAEHRYAGVPCGLMDQLAVIAGRRDHLLAIDFETEEMEWIPWLGPEWSCLLVHTGVEHELASGEYGLRRAACEAAAGKLGLRSLRKASAESLSFGDHGLTVTQQRRARHVVNEIARTEVAIEAVRGGQVEQLGRLMDDSHRSLRDDFEVSCPELDFLVEALRVLPGVWGARMTGGGFGGSVVALISNADFDGIGLERVLGDYVQRFGLLPRWLFCRPEAGAGQLNAGGESGPTGGP